jgi:CubicO group peptidase (beta-lactamase class C family)
MHTDNDAPKRGTATPISRRTLLRSAAGAGAGVLVGGLASTALPAAARAATPRVSGDGPELVALFEKTAAHLLTPGAALIAKTSRGDALTTYGTGVLGERQAPTLTERFRIGSVTKTFTGTVILQLAQHGDLDLEHPVSRYWPGVPNGNQITIEQLMTMHSGLYNYSLSESLNRSIDEHPTKSYRPQEMLKVAFAARPDPKPGGAFEYCNTNTVLLGLIAERLDGRPLAQQFRERLFAPLGMKDTLMPPLTMSGLPSPHPQGYMYGTNVSTLHTERLPPEELKKARDGKLKPNDVTDSNPSWAGAAGAAISTAKDMATWAKGLCDGSLLNRAWQRKRLDSIISSDPNSPGAAGYGLAIAKFGPLYGHTGEIPGFQTFVGYDPDKHTTLVVLTNLKASPEGDPPATEIARELIGPIYS